MRRSVGVVVWLGEGVNLWGREDEKQEVWEVRIGRREFLVRYEQIKKRVVVVVIDLLSRLIRGDGMVAIRSFSSQHQEGSWISGVDDN